MTTLVSAAMLLMTAWVCVPRGPFLQRIGLRLRGDDHDAGRRAELAWWNDPREHSKRRALKAADDVRASVADQTQFFGDAEFVIHAECVGRPMVIIVGEKP